jgi:hypothetical protein
MVSSWDTGGREEENSGFRVLQQSSLNPSKGAMWTGARLAVPRWCRYDAGRSVISFTLDTLSSGSKVIRESSIAPRQP